MANGFSYNPNSAGGGFTNPYAGIGAPATGRGKFTYNPDPSLPKQKPLTVQQYIKMQAAQKAKHSDSFWGEIKHAGSEALHPVAWTFDKLLRPEYAIASGVDKGIQHGSFNVGAALHGAREGFMGRNKEGFGQVLAHHGVLSGHGTLRGLAGFGLDIAADPLTYVTGGTGNILTHGAEHAAMVAAGKTAIEGGAETLVMKAAAKTLASGGEKYAARHALAETRLAQEGQKSLTAAHDAQLSVNTAMAKAEEKANEKFLPQYQIGSRLLNKHVPITPTSIMGKRVVPALPKLDNFIARGGIGSKAAEGWRDKFIRPAGETSVTHAALISHKHIAEERASTNSKIVRDILKSAPKLKKAEMQHALKVAEETKGLVLKRVLRDGTHQLNNARLNQLVKKGALTNEQADFVRHWHKATEALHVEDKKFGVSYTHWGEATGRVYVPHLVDKSGNTLSDVQIGHLTKAGFQKSRMDNPNLSVMHLAQLHEDNLLPHGIETDPYKILAHTARARATKQADATLLNSYAQDGLGISRKLVNEQALAKNAAKQAGLDTARTKREADLAASLAKQEDVHGQFLTEHELAHQTALAEHDAKIRSVKYGRSSKKIKPKDDFFFDHVGGQHSMDQIHQSNEWYRNRRVGALHEAEQRFNDLQAEEQHAADQAGHEYHWENFDPHNPDHIHPELEHAVHEITEHVHNVHDEHGNVVGSLHYTEHPHHVDAHSIFIRPGSRNFAKGHFKELIRPLMESGKEIESHIVNPRLYKLAERMGLNMGGIEKGFQAGYSGIERGAAPLERLPRLVTAPNRTKAAQLANLNRTRVKMLAQHGSDLGTLAKGQHPELNRLLAPHAAEADKHIAALNNMAVQESRLKDEEAKILGGKPNPKYDPTTHRTPGETKDKNGNLTGGDVLDKHGNPMAFPHEVAGAIKRYKVISSGDDKAVEKFGAMWRKWTANWKLAVTSVNPGYRIRNTMSDVWSMYLSGVPMPMIPVYGLKARNLMAAAKKGDPKAVRQLAEAYHHGILSGLYQGDIQAIGKMLQYSGTKRSLAQEGHFIKLGTKVAQESNAHIENLGRLTHYLYRRDRLGESVATAADKVKAAHFDYEDLTPFEQKYAKQVMPFYTWSRKNIPFQVKQIVKSPGQMAAFPKLAQESEGAAGGDKGNIIPPYIAQNFGFQIPFGKHNYYLPQIGATDLQVFDSKGGLLNRATGLANPALRVPFELMANKNFSTGAQIRSDTHPRNPVSGLGADLLRLIPGSNVGPTSRVGPGGKEIVGPGANPYYQYLLGQLPMARELGISSSGIQRQKTPIPPELSYLGGQSVQHIDPAQQRQIAQIQLANNTKKEIAGLRDAGQLPRAKRPKVKSGSNSDRIARTLNLNLGRQ